MGDHGMKHVETPLFRLLAESKLEDCMFGAAGFNKEERAAIFGYGNENIDGEFARLKVEIIRLARCGRCSHNVIADAEPVLESLVKGMQQEEWAAKQGINPREAETDAQTYRLLEGTLSPTGAVAADDIDHWQNESMFSYQYCKYTKSILIDMLGAVRSINRLIETGGPGPDR